MHGYFNTSNLSKKKCTFPSWLVCQNLTCLSKHLQNYLWPELKEGSSQVKWTHLSCLIWMTTPRIPLFAVPNWTHKKLISRLVLPHQWASSLKGLKQVLHTVYSFTSLLQWTLNMENQLCVRHYDKFGAIRLFTQEWSLENNALKCVKEYGGEE